MKSKIIIVLTPPRIEFLKHLDEVVFKNKCKFFLIETPEIDSFYDYLLGRITVDDFLLDIELEYPEFTKELHILAKKIFDNYKISVIPVDPYAKISQEVKIAAFFKKLNEVLRDLLSKYIAILELRISQVLRDYYLAQARKDFDKLVELTVKFAKLDAQRIKFRCELRARKIAELIKSGMLHGLIIIHTYHLHDILVRYLQEKLKDVEIEVINLQKIVLNKLGISMPTHPGRELTLRYVYGEKIDPEEERLLGARSVLYVRLIPKHELRPSNEIEYPHTLKDLEILSFVNRLSYDECKSYFYNVLVK